MLPIELPCPAHAHLNEPSLNDNEKLQFLTLFKCVLLKILPNVERSLLSNGGPFTLFLTSFLFIIHEVFGLNLVKQMAKKKLQTNVLAHYVQQSSL